MSLFSKLSHIWDARLVSPAFQQYQEIAPQSVNRSYPTQDLNGNNIANIFCDNISGTTYSNNGSNPQTVLPKLTLGDRLILMPDPENTHDAHAIQVRTEQGAYIGWVPKNHRYKDLMFRHLTEGYGIYAQIFELWQGRDSNWYCSVRFVTYATPFDPSMSERARKQKADCIFHLQEDAEAEIENIPATKRLFFDAVRQIALTIPHTSEVVRLLRQVVSSDGYWIVMLDGTEILKMKQTPKGALTYWLFPAYFDTFTASHNTTLRVELGSKKEFPCCRVYIEFPGDLFEFSDTIKTRILYAAKHGLNARDVFPCKD